jgi:hypothetical protein
MHYGSLYTSLSRQTGCITADKAIPQLAKPALESKTTIDQYPSVMSSVHWSQGHIRYHLTSSLSSHFTTPEHVVLKALRGVQTMPCYEI